jgi:hypothetical protein
MTNLSLPSPGSPRSRFPCFNGTIKRCDFLPSLSPRFVVLRLAIPHRAPVFVAPTRPDAGLGPGVFGLATPSQVLPMWRRQDLSGSWETPCAYALFLDPGRTSPPGRYGGSAWPPLRPTSRAPTMSQISRLDSRALALAVYASPPALPQHDAKLASGCWPGSPARDCLPAGSHRKVSELLPTSLPPSPSFPDAMVL